MNNRKTEFITFGKKSCLKKQDLHEIRVGHDVVKGSHTIKSMGLTLDRELKITKFKKRIRKYLTEDETKMFMCSVVLSCLDYGNTILVNLPKKH